jgi:hypothetical protein
VTFFTWQASTLAVVVRDSLRICVRTARVGLTRVWRRWRRFAAAFHEWVSFVIGQALADHTVSNDVTLSILTTGTRTRVATAFFKTCQMTLAVSVGGALRTTVRRATDVVGLASATGHTVPGRANRVGAARRWVARISRGCNHRFWK